MCNRLKPLVPKNELSLDSYQTPDQRVVHLVSQLENEEAVMSATSEVSSRALSRRIVLLRSAGCAAGAAALLLPVKEAAAKMKQASVDYQDSPKGDQECSNCSLFQEPNACTLVDGEISPKGWCKFWVKKAG